MATREFKGNAVVTTLSGGISAADTAISIAASTNWPTGTGADQFVGLIISADGATREKVLFESRAGTTLTVATSGRGHDGTTASSFSTGATIVHVADATWMQLVDDHIWDTGLDHHTQYLTEIRHDALAHAFGAAFPDPGDPSDIGTSNNEGVGTGPARSDHVHQIGTGAIDTASQFADNVITTAKVADQAITGAKLNADTAGDGLGWFGALYVKTDGVTCQVNGSDEIEVIGAAVGTGGIADNAITQAKMADDSVGAAEIIALAVGTAELAASAVTTAKIADGNVTPAKLWPSIPRGRLAHAERATTQSGITANVAISSLSATCTPDSAQRYLLVHLSCQAFSGSIGDEVVRVTCKRNGTTIGQFYSETGNFGDFWWNVDDAPASSQVFTIEVARNSGTGTVSIDGTATEPITLEVFDVGGH